MSIFIHFQKNNSQGRKWPDFSVIGRYRLTNFSKGDTNE
jgi:hypothetical protein